MKKIILIYLFISLTYFGFSQTNVYHPMPQGWGATWHSTHVVSVTGLGQTYTYKTTMWGGDTIINSLNYTIVYEKNGSNFDLVGGIRQDILSEKVYSLNFSTKIETDISFNQHLQIGDTITTSLVPHFDFDTTFIVTEIDSIPFLGNYRKKISLEAEDNNSQTEYITYVAGIGFIGYGGFEWSWGVDCFFYENNLIIGAKENPACILSYSDLPKETALSVYPNPTCGLIQFNKTPDYVQIYAIDGKKVQSDLFTLTNNYLDISKLKEGIYQINFQFKHESIIKRIVKL